MLRRPQPLTSFACCLLVGLAGCSGGSSSVGYESPEACFDGIRDAIAKKDYPKALASVTDETQNAFTAGLVMVGSMMKAFGGMAAMGGGPEAEKAKAAVTAINDTLEKYGVTDEKMTALMEENGGMMGMMQGPPSEETIAKMASVVDDKVGFILSMIDVLTTVGDGQGPDPQELIDALAKAKLVDVKIDGDTATAKVEVDGKDPQDIEFRKVAAGWKLHMNMEDMQGGPEPGELEMGEMNMEEFGDAAGDEMEMDIEEFDANPAEFEADEEAVAK